MKTFLIGEKTGMTRMFDHDGNAVGVTVLKVLPATVLRVKDQEKDGYEAIQVGAGSRRNVGKAVLGQGSGQGFRVIQEFPKPEAAVSQGGQLGIEQVTVGDLVNVTATSKGKGFQGVIKRHNFSRGPKSHGSRHHRAPGSIGGTGAARVFPGQPMPGRMGAETVTTQNVAVMAVHPDEGVVLIRGSVPGVRGGLVVVRTTGEKVHVPVPPVDKGKHDHDDDADEKDAKDEKGSQDDGKSEKKADKDDKKPDGKKDEKASGDKP